MRVDTGPGRVEGVKFDDSPVGLGIYANLCNFDFDGDALKPEHEQWLDVYAVPLLNLGKDWKVDIFGEASRVGNDEYNLMLSRLRAFGVEGYLDMTAGVATSHFDLTLGMGSSDAKILRHGLDDERDRGVIIYLFRDSTTDPVPPIFDHLEAQWQTDPLNTGK